MAFLSTFTDSSKPSGGAEMRALFESIQAGNRHAFLQPTSAISNASLQLAKATLDSYAGQISDEQQQRQKEANKKRKRAEHPSKTEVLKIRRLHVDGFESGQVWQQARRIIASTLQDSKEALEELEDRKEVHVNGVNGDATALGSSEAHSESDPDSNEDELVEQFSDSEEDLDEDEEGVSVVDDDELSEELLEDDLGEGAEDIEEEDDEDADEGGEEDEDEDEDQSSGTLVQDPNGLNDGFFSIDEFNKQTQWFEEQDARANPDADEASDDEDVDWHADPLSSIPPAGSKPSKKPKVEEGDGLPSDMEDDEDEDGGPVFGNMDLDAPEGESDQDEEEDDVDGDGDLNANDVFYKDFFAPPKRKGPKKGKPWKPTEPRSAAPADQDVDRAMADVHRDLFEDESEREDSDDALSDASAGDPKSRKSAHERRQAKLAEEIRTLEAANVAKREWALAGEAKAIDRPMNSLLEQDLDFEHIGKPVPVITTEVSEDIEDMIKRRILAQEFDEVVKRRPDSADLSAGGAATRRGLVDLDDTKAKQSLAELYEEEHVQSANPDTYVSQTDEKLRREEREVEQLWRDVSAKLDALSSWHYRPKPAAPSLTVVADVAAVSMEDAQPATAQGVTGGDTALAPQEIYAPGRDKGAAAEKGEVVLAKSGLPLARQEMSREERTRRRRRQKERIRKAGGGAVAVNGGGGATAANGGGKADKTKKTRAQEQRDTLDNLKKGGVKVINKKGEVVDMEGNKARAAKAASSQSFKL
ncbi:U3 snoRNP protein [Diatrype stigma]|uniref:U3 small nucleolar ribonucleoprotein protein MPP10 n=1 Tax=Diatrype stigma TaxID=117547 RepID=A0AAN9YUX5_9PEZI